MIHGLTTKAIDVFSLNHMTLLEELQARILAKSGSIGLSNFFAMPIALHTEEPSSPSSEVSALQNGEAR